MPRKPKPPISKYNRVGKHQYTKKQIDEILEDAWLNLEVDPRTLYNPLKTIPKQFDGAAQLWVTYLLSRPEYFFSFCNHIFNFKLAPYQHVILHELWNRKFPMLIGARGSGKCQSKDSFICTNTGIIKIGDLVGDIPENTPKKIDNCRILGECGYSELDYCWNNGLTDTLKITTKLGYEIECTYNHPLRAIVEENIEWKNVEDLRVGDYLVIDRGNNCKVNDNIDDNKYSGLVNEELAYLFGALVGDGGYTNRQCISLTNKDKEVINKCKIAALNTWGKTFSDTKHPMQFVLHSVKIWDELFNKYGFNSPICAEKDCPKSVLVASESVICSYIKGLMDTDGTCENCAVSICMKSKNCIKTLQFLLSRLGIISSYHIKYNKKYDRNYYRLSISGTSLRIYADKSGFAIKYKTDKLNGIVAKVSNTNVDCIPKELFVNRLLRIKNFAFDSNIAVVKGTGDIYERKLIRPYRLSRYNISYTTAKKILDILKLFSSLKEYIELKELLDKNYFYDKIVKIEESKSVTYDVHLKDDHSFISNGFISHNSTLLGIHALMRAILLPGRKVVITAASFRQSKTIFQYIEDTWNKSPLLRDIAEATSSSVSHGTDMWKLTIGDSSIIALPTGNGDKIRGQRAHDIIVDEMSVIPIDILENVVVGFASVSSSPVENMIKRAAEKKRQQLGFVEKNDDNEFKKTNQIIIAGTAYYSFNHFHDYWKKWKQIIYSKGDRSKLQEIFDKEDIPEDFDWRDYSVIRLPYTMLPDGYMDRGQIARSKATVSAGIFLMEYAACFCDDSQGFFRRTLIEGCIAHERKGIYVNDKLITFPPTLKGSRGKKYVMGVDPASEVDNFSVIIQEINDGYLGIVYCWTTNSKSHKLAIKQGLTQELNFYSFCARKIRDLMKAFQIEEIAIDSQGGGRALYEALHEKDKLEDNEYLLWEIMDDKKPKDSDFNTGLHIIKLINFADAKWTNDAHHNLRKDFETKTTLFPYFDSISIGLANLKDQFEGREEGIVYDTLEDIVFEIEELKNELATIAHTQTPSGRDHFDVPEIKLPGGKKGKQKKDRVSALVMANASARELMRNPEKPTYQSEGGFAESVKVVENAILYPGNDWYNRAAMEAYSGY